MFDKYGRTPETQNNSSFNAVDAFSKEEFKEVWENMPIWEQRIFIEYAKKPMCINDLNVHGGRIVLSLIEILKITKSVKNKSQKLVFGGLKIERKGDIIYIGMKK